jgi:hypothetical protein
MGLGITHGLIDVYVGAARTSNADTDMVFRKKFAGQTTAFAVEGCREHHVTMVRILIHVFYMSAQHTESEKQ